MLRRSLLPALVFGAVIALALTPYALRRPDPPEPVGPRTLDQMARIAEKLGLYHRSDIRSGEVSIRLVISDRPLTFERANSLHMGEPEHACWWGTVAACAGGRDYLYLSDPDHGVLWGDIFLFGDPVLIRQLMSAP